MYQIKKIAKRMFGVFGLNVSKTLPNPLLHHEIELIFDVGANIGQYAMEVRHAGFKGVIASFEPIPQIHETLLKNSENDQRWVIHKRCAVGSVSGETEINISQNSLSSSLLPMLKIHSSAAPNSIYIGKEKTEVITLDSIFQSYRGSDEKVLLKIDTQGFEKQVLDGLSENLKNIFAVQLELSIVPLYKNQETYQYFFSFFERNGFMLWSLLPGFGNSMTGQLLQFDAVFVRKN
jgi:FkbM family methyltransferase